MQVPVAEDELEDDAALDELDDEEDDDDEEEVLTETFVPPDEPPPQDARALPDSAEVPRNISALRRDGDSAEPIKSCRLPSPL